MEELEPMLRFTVTAVNNQKTQPSISAAEMISGFPGMRICAAARFSV
ncbi:hypothetical protein [Pseudomonas sp. NFR16]|nr:hypothetical protein [Pseudomonas sp. NFR16]